MFVLVMSDAGINDAVRISEDKTLLLDEVEKFFPSGSAVWQSFGYKDAILSEDGETCYEIFEVEETKT